ncbi:MAG: hypothetical protein ACTSXD_03630 [Candidatus Heimdallarchaeaceae archaeon]
MKNQNKTIKEFSKWLNEKDRQNWEIERYVEVMLEEIENKKLDKIIEMLEFISSDIDSIKGSIENKD